MRYLAVLLCLFPLLASATDVTLTWEWPTSYCPAEGETQGDPLPIEDITAAEIYIATAPIPRVPSACDVALEDTPPSGAIIQTVTTPDTSVTIDLECGQTYYFVMRNQAKGKWSNFSAEAQRILDCERPGIPIIISLS